jgi:hypothetical protein|tara:strand:+ start:817 stop:1293 length:477 start_codon:yes stop_codon:yes gene_type:complete
MVRYETDIKKSDIAGLGLFAGEDIPKGSVIAIWCPDLDHGTLSLEEYLDKRLDNKSEHAFQMTCCRWLDNLFVYGDTVSEDGYINHSFDPSMLYYLGICFARKEIKKGDELTINFEYILTDNDPWAFVDSKTNKKVDGMPSEQYYRDASHELWEIFCS